MKSGLDIQMKTMARVALPQLLLSAEGPYLGASFSLVMQDTNRATLYSELDFERPPWDTLTPEAKELVQALLQRDPQQRPSAADALQHRQVTFNTFQTAWLNTLGCSLQTSNA